MSNAGISEQWNNFTNQQICELAIDHRPLAPDLRSKYNTLLHNDLEEVSISMLGDYNVSV